MRKLAAKLLLGLAILTAAAAGADNSLGTWKLNVAKSKFAPGPIPYKNLTLVREAVDGGVKHTATGARVDGSAVSATYTVKYDGTPARVTGAGFPWDTTTMKQIDANTFTSVRTKAGTSYRTSVTTTISKHGKTLTSASKGIGADGKPISSQLVYEKQQSAVTANVERGVNAGAVPVSAAQSVAASDYGTLRGLAVLRSSQTRSQSGATVVSTAWCSPGTTSVGARANVVDDVTIGQMGGAAIPEPGTFAALAIGLVIFVLYRR